MNRIAPVLTIVLFVAGAIGGAAAFAVLNPPPQPSRYPTVPFASEPGASSSLARILESHDAEKLASTLDRDRLAALGEALQPLVEISEVRFVNAVSFKEDTLAAYVASGRSAAGETLAVALRVQVRNNTVVGLR